MTKEQLIAMLEACQSSKDWNNACDKIKRSHEDGYPDYWWKDIIMSGMADRIMAKWGRDTEIRIVGIKS